MNHHTKEGTQVNVHRSLLSRCRAVGISRRVLLLVVLSCGALLGVGATPAGAKIAHKSEGSFNGSERPTYGSFGFSLPSVAVQGSNADVWVTEAKLLGAYGKANLVDKFEGNGKYAGVQITGETTPQGGFSFGAGNYFGPQSGIAVDNTASGSNKGDLYVSDSGHGVIDRFSETGSFLCQITAKEPAARSAAEAAAECNGAAGSQVTGTTSIEPTGLAVDSSGNLYVADKSHSVIDVFGPKGEYVKQIASTELGKGRGLGTIALDSAGNLYVSNAGEDVVEFDSSGIFKEALDQGHSPLGVGVDTANNHVYITDRRVNPNSGNEESDIAEFEPSAVGAVFLDAFSYNESYYGFASVTVGPTGKVYASQAASFNSNFEGTAQVYISGPDLLIPNVTAAAASLVKQFTATVNGEVDPAGGGNVESCQFEYGTSTSYGQSAPCSPATPYASVTTVSASLSALSPETTYHFRVAASNSNGIVSYSSDETFTTPPLAETGQATNLTVSSATLGGTVNPDGATMTDCHFEYGKTASYGHSQPCSSTPSGSSPVAVSADITELAENTTYHFRLVVAYSEGSNTGSGVGTDVTFTTLSRPHIDNAYTSNLTSNSVDLNAQINPEGLDTTYYFEWGTEAGNYTHTEPVTDIGPGTSDVPVTQHLEGLSANTTYHWRVVANNSVGTTFGQDHTFVYQTATSTGTGCQNEQLRAQNALSLSLPDCRAYEQVSPVDKNDSDVVNAFGGGVNQQASVDGERVFYESFGAFPGAPNALSRDQYLALRGASGWLTRPVGYPLTSTHLPSGTATNVGYNLPLSPDLSTGVLLQGDPPLVAGAPAGVWNLYVGKLITGSFQLVTTATPPAQGESYFFEGASADFSHVIVLANNVLTPEAPSGVYNLYEGVGGQLRLVGLIPTSGTSCTGAECTPADGEEAGGRNQAWPFLIAHAISADGSRIVFSTGANESEKHIYDRLNGTTTVDVSASQRTPAEPGSPSAHYQDAGVDGSHVLFTSEGALTNDAVPGSGLNLYDYDVETGKLTDLTAANDARVRVLAGLSEDASHVYFVADGVLAANSNSHGDTAIAGQPNLYLWNGGQTTFIATTYITEERQNQPIRVTPDGAYLTFNSTASLTGYDNTDATTGEPDSEVYLYAAAANRLICASCNPSGARPIGPSDLHSLGSVLYAPRNLSADGSRVFFTSRDALLPGDTNGLSDVYEWEAEGSGSCQSSTDNGGCLYLISDGSAAASSYFADASPSGNDAFFATGASLVGQDEDSFADLYDARVGGGFASQGKRVVPPACASLEGCRAPLSEPPAQFGVASAELHGSGNLATPAEAPEKKPEAPEKKHVKKHVKKHPKKHPKKHAKKHAKKHRAANNHRRAGR